MKNMNEKIRFIMKVTAAHFVTYLICGLLFSTLVDYKALFALGNAKYYMKDAYGNASMIGPFVQIVRGLLIGCILLILKDNVLTGKRAWLRLWILFVGLGIICTPAAAPVSIEGMIYSQLPLAFHIKTEPEVLVQTLLFSIWVTNDFKWKLPEKIKVSIIVTAISGVGFPLGGVLLTLALKGDMMESAGDPFAYLIMLVALVIVFLATWYLQSEENGRFIVVYYLICYFATAVLPTIYNYASGSVMRSPLSLVFSGLPVIAIGIYLSLIKRK